MQTLDGTATGPGGTDKLRPMWSDVIPKAKLVYGVGWFNVQSSLLGPKSPNGKIYNGSPSFCAAAAIVADKRNSKRRMDDSGTWVVDRKDGSNLRLWCPPPPFDSTRDHYPLPSMHERGAAAHD